MTMPLDEFKRKVRLNRLMDKVLIGLCLTLALIGGFFIWLAWQPEKPVYLFSQNSCRVYVVSHARRDSTEFLCRCLDSADVGHPASGKPRTARLSRLLL